MKKNNREDLVFLLVLFLISLLLMCNFNIQMADLHEDDGPMFYARAFAQPQLFQADYIHGIPFNLITPFRVWTSLQLLVPAILFKFLSIQPNWSTWVLVFLQIFGFGCAIYYFLLTSGKQRPVAVVGTFFAYIAGIWGWSLTYAESDFRSILAPVPAIQAMTPLLFALALFLKKRNKPAFGLLLLAGLIHPTMALYSIGALGLWFLFKDGLAAWKKVIAPVAALGVISVLISAPAFLVKFFVTYHSLPVNEVLAGMRLNVHIWPWGFGLHWPPMQTTVIWLFVAFLGYRSAKNRKTDLHTFWLASLASSAIIGTSHVFGALIKNTTLMDLIGLRAFTIAVFVSFPLVLDFFEGGWFSRGYLFRLTALLFFLESAVIKHYGLSWFLAGSLCLVWILDLIKFGTIKKWQIFPSPFLRLAAWGLTVVNIIFFILGDRVHALGLPHTLTKAVDFFFGYEYLFAGWVIPALVVLLAAGLAVLDKERMQTFSQKLTPAGLVMGGCAVLFALVVTPQLLADRTPEAFARMDIQNWARAGSPEGSFFWAPGFNGWRSLAERGRMDDYTRENYAYIYAIEEGAQYRNRVLSFFGLSDGIQKVALNSELHQKETALIKGFTTEKYRQLAEEFNVNYAVLKKGDYPALGFPVVYSNDFYDVYRLTQD